MKKLSFYLIMLIVFVSCSKQLDKSPYGVVSTDNFYKTAQDAEKAVFRFLPLPFRPRLWRL